MSFLGRCMCGCVVSTWEHEYPCRKDHGGGIPSMHSPVGCTRRGSLSVWQQRDLYRKMTGFDFGNQDERALFQALMFQFRQHPEFAERYAVVTSPVPTHEPRVFQPLALRHTNENPRVGTPVRVGSINVNGEVYKPPWER